MTMKLKIYTLGFGSVTINSGATYPHYLPIFLIMMSVHEWHLVLITVHSLGMGIKKFCRVSIRDLPTEVDS